MLRGVVWCCCVVVLSCLCCASSRVVVFVCAFAFEFVFVVVWRLVCCALDVV